jgi:ABC-type glycerol-3-phosphate transport system substrate-binding protein
MTAKEAAMPMRWRLVLWSVFCAGWLSGCGPAKPSGPHLTMWLVGSEAQARSINALAEPFTKRMGIRVQCEAISWGEAHSKYLTAIAGGVEPDIGTMGLTWGIEFGHLGTLVDLQEAFPQDLGPIRAATFPGLWGSIQQGGHVYGIPFDVSLQLLYYRTDLVPRAPQTWDELADVLQQLQRDQRGMLMDWGNLSWIGYAPFLWQAGGDFYNAQKTAATLTTPEAVRALEFFRDLYVRYGVPRTAVPLEQGLRTGDFPLAISGNWKIVSLAVGVPDLAGKWTVGLLPKGSSGKRTAFLGGRTAVIFARSPRRAEAWAFLRYLFEEPEVHKKLYQDGLATQDAYLPPNMTSWDALPMEPGMKVVLKQQAQEAKGPPAVTGWTETTHVLEEAIQSVILKGVDPKAALSRANDAMNRNLNEP